MLDVVRSESVKNEWLADIAEVNIENILDYWIFCIRASSLPSYVHISDEQLRDELRPTVQSMINAFRTGDAEGVRDHTVKVISRRVQQGFSFTEVQQSLHFLEVALRYTTDQIFPDFSKRLDVAESASKMYYRVALIVADVYQSLRVEQQARFMEAYELGTALSKTLKLDEVMDIAVKSVAELADASFAIVSVFREEPQIEVRASRQIDLPPMEICRAVGHEHHKAPIPDIRAEVHQIESIANEPRLARWKNALISEGCLSFICLPLIAAQTRIGNMVVFRDEEHHYAGFEVDFLLALAGHIGTTVQNALLYEEAQGKREISLLLEAGNLFASTLDLHEILDSVSKLAAENIGADFAVVLLLDDAEILHIKSYYAHTGLATKAINRFLRLYGQSGIGRGSGAVNEVLVNLQPILITDYASYPNRVEDVADLVGSLIAVPIKLKDKVIGIFALGSVMTNAFVSDDVMITSGVVAQAGIAIENANLYAHEKNIAETLQRSFLPTDIPDIPGYEVGVSYRAALDEAELGGDFYDVFHVGAASSALLIADVSGKGLQAATHTAMGKYTMRAYARLDPSPIYVLRNFNNAYMNYATYGMFITAFYLVLDTSSHTLTYASAGHNPPLLYKKGPGFLTHLNRNGPGIGIVEDAEYTERKIEMEPGDTLLLYTDGATDVRWKHQMLGIKGLERLFRGCLELPADKIVDTLFQGIIEYGHGRLSDDVALMVLKRPA